MFWLHCNKVGLLTATIPGLRIAVVLMELKRIGHLRDQRARRLHVLQIFATFHVLPCLLAEAAPLPMTEGMLLEEELTIVCEAAHPGVALVVR